MRRTKVRRKGVIMTLTSGVFARERRACMQSIRDCHLLYVQGGWPVLVWVEFGVEVVSMSEEV